MKQKTSAVTSKSKPRPVLRRMQFKVDPESARKLSEVAKASGRTVSNVVRAVMEVAVTDKGLLKVMEEAEREKRAVVTRYLQSNLFPERVLERLKKP